MDRVTRAVDLHVDGSLRPDGGEWRGGWGAVLAIGEEVIGEFSGALKCATSSSTLCEAQAAANAVHAALKAGLIHAGDRVTIWADNRSAVQLIARVAFKRRSTNRRADYGKVKKWIERVSAEHGITITGRWIRGHQSEAKGEADHRIRFNRRADRLCGIVTGTRKDPAALARGAEAHRRAVIHGQKLKDAHKAERRQQLTDRTAKLARAIGVARALEDGGGL